MNNETNKLSSTKRHFVPSGYYPDGKPKPMREINCLEKHGTMIWAVYSDTGEQMCCPHYAITSKTHPEGYIL